MHEIMVKISRINMETDAIRSIELVGEDDKPLPPFTAGAHIDVHVAPGLIRQYSLCNDPAERHRFLIGVLRDPASRGGSLAVHAWREGERVRISAPKNYFSLVPARKTLLFGGGIGITPMICMAEQMARQGDDFTLHYCARSPSSAAFRDRLAASSYAGQIAFHFDDGDDAQRLDAAAALAHPQTDTHVYVCGPAGFIDHIVGTAQALGWHPDSVHVEYFAAKAADASHDHAFAVRIASTGQVFDIPADQSVATVLMAHGIEIPMSCEQGVCGTCVTRILEGQAEHRDLFLTDAERDEGDQFTPCCSRAKGNLLVLDL